nr:hypothetical protein [Tanacetum cinerariifolium]
MPLHIIVKNTRTMDMTIDQQVALDEALIPHESGLRIGKSVSGHNRCSKDLHAGIMGNCHGIITPYGSRWTTRNILHNEKIRRLTDVNINKLHQPWRSFAAIINKCLSGKSTGYDSLRLRLSQAQILWGLYHKRNVDFAYLLCKDFIYQVEYNDAKKSNEMYYPRFTKFGAMLPIELTNEDIKNSEAYKEYYAVAIGAAPPKTKASVRKKKSSSDTTVTPPTAAAGSRLSTSAKGKQPAKASKAKSLIVLSEVAMTKAEQLKLATKKSLQQTHISQASGSGADEGTGIITRVPDVPTEESDEEISWKSSDEEDDDGDDDQDEGDDDDDQDKGNDDDQDSDEEGEEFIHPKLRIHDEEETKDKESFDPIAKTPENSDDEGNDEENLSLNVGREEGQDEDDDEDKLYRDVTINLEGRVVQMANVHTTQEFEDTRVTLTPITSQLDVQVLTTVAPLTLSTPTLTLSTVATISTVPQAPTPPTTTLSTLLQDLPNFGSLFGFDHRLKTLEANFSEFMQTNQFAGAIFSILGIVQRYMDQRMNEAVKIIKEQVKEQVKVQVSKILLKIEKTVNEQLEVKVLTRSSNSSKTSYAVIADLSEMELNKILIEKIEGNKSIHRSDEQRNLYKALVEAYESNKIILDTYRDTVTLKRRHDDDDVDKDQEPSSGSDRGSKRQRERKKPESTSALKRSLQGTTDQQDWINPEGQQYPHNLLKPLPLIPNFRGRRVSHLNTSSTTTSSIYVEVPQVASTQLLSPRQRQQIMSTSSGLKTWCLAQCGFKNQESARDVYSKRRIIAVTKLKTIEWHNYKHLDWITMRKDDEKLYKFEEGDFKRFRIQDIEDLLLLLVQGKLTNLTVKERFAFNVALRMFTRSIVIQRRMEDLQLDVESYQKKLNLTRPDTYRSDLKRKEAYTAYSNPRGFIYQNKDKQNRLMRINELHKLSDGMLNDVRTALDDRIKGIRMKYLPQTI